jgi:hypothetical protein
VANFKPGDIAVELAKGVGQRLGDDGETMEDHGPRNSYFFLRTFGSTYRGRWRGADIAGGASDLGYTSINTPGIHIIVNPKKRYIRAVDALSFPEHEAELRKANKIRMNSPERSEGRPWDESRIDNATDTDIKTCLFELREFLDDGDAVCHTDNLPDKAKIMALEGNLIRRTGAPVSGRDGTVPPEHATEEELGRMGQPQAERVKIVPAKAGT